VTGAFTAVLQAIALTLVGVLGVGTVLMRDPLRQVVLNSMLGLSLVVAFGTLQAPDVAIAEAAVSAIAAPMVLLPVIYKTHGGGKG
jgi:uncharacterized MnhB-related membrane protein